MSISADRAMPMGRTVAASWYCAWVPLLGGLWVMTNVLLVEVGLHVAHPLPCSMVAGMLNGTLLSVIAIAKVSGRLQAGATGLLSGLSLTGLRNDGSLLWKAAESTHPFVDQALLVLGVAGNEQIHQRIEMEALQIVWTTLFVVLASLIAQWVLTSRPEN